MDSMFVPSSNAENVITKKINGEKVISVKHWRTDKLKNLFEVCQLQIPEAEDISYSFFIKQIPWYVRKKRHYSGLCAHCNLGIHFGELLKKARISWHEKCKCRCVFCKKCEHGKNPEGIG